ncbi:MAG: response regulator [Oscillospiraceae bacterium]|nr:response regulator [Oscillospiraceae bacterium]
MFFFELLGDSPLPENIEYELDIVRCQQILAHLLNNALKFTPCGGKVNCSVKHLARTEQVATEQISISDTGCGMSEEFQKKMFELFSQEADDFSRPLQGPGLGLSMVKKLIDTMGGTIEVKSRLGEGSTFVVTLSFPWRYRPQEEPAALPAQKDILNHKHVLVAEDNQINAAILVNILEYQGMSAQVAADGAVAVNLFRSAPVGTFDAILMDIRMPNMDGLEACRMIRGMDRPDAGLPILAVTANAAKSDEEESLKAGMDAHLTKPVDTGKLYGTLERCFAQGK